MTYKKWAKHLIERFGRDIRMYALTGQDCPCRFFEWRCGECEYHNAITMWCGEAEGFYVFIFEKNKKIKKLKKKILKRLRK